MNSKNLRVLIMKLAALLFIVCIESCNIYIIDRPLLPGYYIVDKNMYTKSIYNMTISLKVHKIAVYEDYSTEIFCTWVSTYTPGKIGYILKKSDDKNYDMYIKDNFGNKYNHILTTGIAYDSYGFSGNDSADGTFVFSPINTDASSITFYDDDQGKSITIKFSTKT